MGLGFHSLTLFMISTLLLSLLSALALDLICMSQAFGLSVSFKPISCEVSHKLTKASTQLEDHSTLWSLRPTKYWVYDITDSQMAPSTKILSPPHKG